MAIKIAVLGAGPAGLALAMKLLRRDDLECEVEVVEKKPGIGGLASSFSQEGLYFDYGSHRLHPATAENILHDIRGLLGDDLLDRPRNGRIRLLGKFVRFPLRPADILRHLPASFMWGIGKDKVAKVARGKNGVPKSFHDVLVNSLGPTLCHAFYFPYARKLWGMDPDDISAVQAKKRVAANSIGKIVRKVLRSVSPLKPKGTGRFYYPRKGYGQICDTLAAEVRRLGGRITTSAAVEGVHVGAGGARLALAGGEAAVEADIVFSTIPMPALVHSLQPAAPDGILADCRRLRFRRMVLCYITLEADQFSPYDAHYFPETDVIFSRLSEPKNYSASREPRGLTGLCAEIPCSPGDGIWEASSEEITAKVLADLERCGLPVEAAVRSSFIRRVPNVYPIYDADFADRFRRADEYLNDIPGLVSLGRQGLFAHDNTHHTMEMAYRASECLGAGGRWDAQRWRAYREKFDEHVVED